MFFFLLTLFDLAILILIVRKEFFAINSFIYFNAIFFYLSLSLIKKFKPVKILKIDQL